MQNRIQQSNELMDMSMACRISVLLAAAIFLLAAAWPARGQQVAESQTQPSNAPVSSAGPIFYEQFDRLLDPEDRTYFSLQTVGGQQFGGQLSYSGIGASHYLGTLGESITLLNAQALSNYRGNPAASVGFQQRFMGVLAGSELCILGAGAYLDVSQSRHDKMFQQVGVSLELFTESAWVGRANGYLPVGQTQTNTAPAVNQGGPAGQLSIVGNTVGFGGFSSQQADVALTGTDFELGRKFFNYRMETYGGYYNWMGHNLGFANGVKGGVRGFITESLSGNINVCHDQIFGTSVYGGLTFVFGGNGGRRPLSFTELMTQPVQRSQQVAVQNISQTINTFHAAHDLATGSVLHTYFVTEGGNGLGSQSSPTNVLSVLGNSNFSDGSAIVLMNNNGTITDSIALTHSGQQVIGGGSTGTANIDFSQAMGQAAGTDVLHLTGLGGRPVLATTAQNGVALTNQNVIQGFTIDGIDGLTNGVSGNPGASNTVINDMVFQNLAGTGVIINPSTNTTISNSTFTNNGTDIKLDAVNSQITNVNSNGAKNGSISLGAGGNITGTTTISNVNITGAGGFGGVLLNNAQNGSTTNLTNVEIQGGAGSGAGISVTNAQTGSIFNLAGIDVANTGSHGIFVQNSAGTLNVDSRSTISNTGASAFAISGASINVNYNGSISQANNFAALDISNHGGTVTFGAGSSITTTSGSGLQFSTDTGTYNMNGTINMNGGDAMIFIGDGTGVFTFNDPFINNAGLDAGVKIASSGGPGPVTTFNGLSITTDGTPGFTVTNSGLTTVTGPATINTNLGTALNIAGTAVNMTFANITSTNNSFGSGITINGASGTLSVLGTTTISKAAASGINISNSSGLTSKFQSVAITNSGTNATDNSVTLANAGTVSILGGSIDGSTGDGVHSSDTNLTVTGVTIGAKTAISGNGINVINNGLPHSIVLSNDFITGTTSAITTKDAGNSGELLLTLDGNTLQSTGSGSHPMSITGLGLNSTIIQSIYGGAILGNGIESGALFNRVTFDASGTSLLGTTLNAGSWTIGTAANPIQGYCLQFNGPTGALSYGTLNIANNAGGLFFIDTTTLGTHFLLTP